MALQLRLLKYFFTKFNTQNNDAPFQLWPVGCEDFAVLFFTVFYYGALPVLSISVYTWYTKSERYIL